jgi:hypothetical protein
LTMSQPLSLICPYLDTESRGKTTPCPQGLAVPSTVGVMGLQANPSTTGPGTPGDLRPDAWSRVLRGNVALGTRHKPTP